MNPDDHLPELDQLVAKVRDAERKRQALPHGPERDRLFRQQRTWQRQIGKLRRLILRLRAGPKERTCLECAECTLYSGAEDRHEDGFVPDASLGCDKGHYDLKGARFTKQALRTALLRARTCKDFKRAGFRNYWATK